MRQTHFRLHLNPKKQIKLVKNQGYVILDSELVDGSYSVGFPVYSSNGTLLGSVALLTKKENAARINNHETISYINQLGYAF